MTKSTPALAVSLSLLLAAAALALPAPAGTVAPTTRMAPADATEVASPMKIDVSLGASDVPGRRTAINQLPDGQSRVFSSPGKVVCDKAWLDNLRVKKLDRSGGKVALEVTPVVLTGYDRQNVGVTVALVSDGKEVFQNALGDVSIGQGDTPTVSVRKSSTATFVMARADFDAMFSDDRAPSMRVTLDVGKQK